MLSDEEFPRVLEAIERMPDRHTRAAFVLLVTTGARKSEVLKARWEDVKLEEAEWRIPRAKGGDSQRIPLPSFTISILRSLKMTVDSSPFLFPGREPAKARQDLKRQWNFIRKQTGLAGVWMHDLRRTFGKHITKQAGLLMASRLLRHTNIHVTERHYAPDDMRDRLRVVEKRTREKIVPIRRAR